MVWIGARYVFGSTFSYRIPDFSSSYAAATPIPSPSTVKLALVAAAIGKSGDVKVGEKLFESIKTAQVTIEIPERVAIFRGFIKRLKKKRLGRGFESTFGIREYVLYSGPLTVFVNAPPDDAKMIMESLKAVRYFGTSDSMCTNIGCNYREPCWKKVPRLYSAEDKREGILFLLTDFTEKVTFDRINPYSKVSLKRGRDLVKHPYLFPLKIVDKKKNYTIYELKPFTE